jgi:hypothetical protein
MSELNAVEETGIDDVNSNLKERIEWALTKPNIVVTHLKYRFLKSFLFYFLNKKLIHNYIITKLI